MVALGSLDVRVFQEEDGSFYASVENLPGCFTAASTIEQLDANIREAVHSYLLSVQKDLAKYTFHITKKDITHV
jgi:predicted RNase H-like HicB family nuclease